MADKCIGKLTLDISDVSKKIEDVNKFLGQIGANINLEDKLSKKISGVLTKLVNEAKKAGEEAQRAMGGSSKNDTSIQKTISLYEKLYNARNRVYELEQKGQNESAAYAKAVADVQKYETALGHVAQKIKDAARETKEYNNILEKSVNVKNASKVEAEAKEIEKATQAYLKLLEAKSEVKQLDVQGKQDTEEYLKATQNAGKAYDAFIQYSKGAREAAQASKEAAQARKDLNAIESKNETKANIDAKEAEKATQAYLKLLEAKSKVKQLEVEGKQDTLEYTKATQAAGKAYDAFITYSKGAREAAQASKEAAQARKDLNEIESRVNDNQAISAQEAKVREAEVAYKNLTTAVRNYNIEKKAGNTDRQNMWAQEATSQMQVLSNLEQEINTLHIDEDARSRILSLVEQGRTAQSGMTSEAQKTTNQTGELESQVKGLVTRYLSLMAVIRTISNLIQNMTEYVSEYSDKMNEIQIITMKTDDEIAQLANTYRSLAKDMSVSSLDMADAAIYFTRQGLAAEEIEKRLKNVTMYAKAANVEFKDASEIITSVVNSMDLVEQEAEDGRNATQRVADVFLNIGDNAATSGQEIGEAMQKAAASAGAFGVSMEWLAAYIATVSETTRQEARTIGTAFNTIIARLHQIKQTGYNQEDETKVNDIAKALSKIDVVLMDQAGNWRDMETILEEIADKWGNLDGKTRSYIATTMAGVKQQNVFLALMNDMSKGVENGSRAFELYEKAVDSAGTAEQKYAVYLDSVTAAQERLTIAQENFYSILSQDVIKGWYNTLAGVVDYITRATEAMGGLNIIIPIVAGAVTLLGLGIKSLAGAITTAGSASAWFATVWETHPVLLVITGVAAAIVAITTAVGLFTNSNDNLVESFNKANEALDESQRKLKTYQTVQEDMSSMFENIGDKAKLSADDIKEYNGTLEEIASISPIAKLVVDQLKEGFISQQEAVEKLNNELERLSNNEKEVSKYNLMGRYASYTSETTNPKDASELLYWTNYAKDNLDWYNDMSKGEQFTYILKNFYNNLSKGTVEYIEKLLAQYLDMGVGDDQAWEMISDQVLYKLFGSFEVPDDFSKTMADEVNKEIDYALSMLGEDLDPVQLMAARKNLYDKIFGSDGQIDSREYTEFSRNIFLWLKDFYNNGIDSIMESTDNIDLAKHIAEQMFDPDVFGDMFEYNGEEFAQEFIDSYSELIKNGFTQEEIKGIFESIPQMYWNNGAKVIKDQMRNALTDMWGENPFADVIPVFDNEGNFIDWNEMDMDLSTMKTLFDMAESGAITLDSVRQLIYEADGDVDKFREMLLNYAETVGFVVEDVENLDEIFQVKDIKEQLKEIDTSIKDIQALDKAIKDVKENGKDANISNLLDLANAHPELMTVISDEESLLAMLKKIKAEAASGQRDVWKNIILTDKKVIAGSKYSDTGYDTLNDYRDTLSGDALDAFDAEIEKMIDNWQKANENAKEVTKEAAAEAKNAEKAFSDTVKEVESIDKMIEKIQSNKKLDFSDLVDLSTAHPEIMAFASDADKLIEKLQEIKGETEKSVKEKLKNYMLDSEEYYKESEHYDPRFKNMREYINFLNDSRQDWSSINRDINEAAQNIIDAAKETGDAAKSWLEAQAEIAEINEEVNWAKSNNFEDQINALQGAIESGGIDSAIKLFESWTDEMQKAVASEYPALIKIMGNAKKAMKEQGDQTEVLTKQTKEMKAVLASTEKLNNVKYFTDTAEAIKKLSNGTISATDAIEVYHKEVNKVTKAYEDILDVQNKMEYNEKEAGKGNEQSITGNDVQNLANLLNMTTEQVLADFPAAVDMFDQLTSSTGELADMLNQLSAASFIKITGTSEADFTNLQNGLISIQGMAKETIEQLEKTGLWTVETIKLDTEAWVQNADGTWTSKYLQGYQEILKPTSNNPLSGRTGGTGVKDNSTNNRRGGGGSSKDKNKNSMTEVERALDVMSQVNTIQEGQQGYYQSQQKYYQQTGQLQGVIAYMQRENDVLKNQNVTLEGNIKRIEAYMEKKRAELATLSITDEAYEEVADDLDKLQKAHQTYTKQLVDNKTAMDALTKSIKEQNDKIRQMEIDLRNTILKAIEDRERRTEDMMNAEIEMENKILDLITRRYERERDEIIETTNKRIDLLNEEKNLLSEQLQMRKEQADEEDKLTKLKELEVKYQRIVADPTRRKEALSIRKDIDDLRKEMAWDAAEKEVKAQQDALDKQITNLEDYITYVEEYYEDLFEHPVKLIEEMKSILEKSDAEIIEWLKTNEEEYARSTENTQAKMVSGWQETLDAMRGLIRTYWDEVEQIISQGDEYIIEFLKANSQDYREAGKLQGEAYVDEWKEQLENLKKAHQQVAAEIAASYDVIQKAETSASSKSSGGGGGGGGSKNKSNSQETEEKGADHYYVFTYISPNGRITERSDHGYSSAEAARKQAEKELSDNMKGEISKLTGTPGTTVYDFEYKKIDDRYRNMKRSLVAYSNGGVADFTGPAWLDGSKQDPERILNPYQNKLFESMVQALERMSTISIPGMPDFGGMAAGGNPVSVGDIVVNVENLDTDDDYEELAQKVSEILMDRIGRTAVVGGMRISSF